MKIKWVTAVTKTTEEREETGKLSGKKSHAEHGGQQDARRAGLVHQPE